MISMMALRWRILILVLQSLWVCKFQNSQTLFFYAQSVAILTTPAWRRCIFFLFLFFCLFILGAFFFSLFAILHPASDNMILSSKQNEKNIFYFHRYFFTSSACGYTSNISTFCANVICYFYHPGLSLYLCLNVMSTNSCHQKEILPFSYCYFSVILKFLLDSYILLHQ